MNDSLYVFFADQKVGVLQQEEGSDISFQYSMEWLERGLGAISISLPLREEKYTAKKNSFFANLLPEGDFRIKIERLFQISSGNDFALLQAIGGDCAGALSIASE
ncbi:MAG: HipA N-terminal domain-containing protein, partial [Spirochaetota bacterium]